MHQKTLVSWSFFYAILALVSGVAYRELTRFFAFSGETVLTVIHGHLLVLGTFFFLIVLLLNAHFLLIKHALYTKFFVFYNTGLILTVIMMAVRGVTEVMWLELSRGANMSIAGLAGVWHIVLAVGLIYFFVMLKKVVQ